MVLLQQCTDPQEPLYHLGVHARIDYLCLPSCFPYCDVCVEAVMRKLSVNTGAGESSAVTEAMCTCIMSF